MLRQRPDELPCLLRDPWSRRMGGDPGDRHAASANRDEEEDLQGLQPERLNGNEITGEHRVSIMLEKSRPVVGMMLAVRGRQNTVLAQAIAHRRFAETIAELEQLPLDFTSLPGIFAC